LKILLVHNFYGSAAPSGENQVFLEEKALLQSRGHTIIEFTRASDDIRALGWRGAIVGGLTTPWNFRSARDVAALVAEARPDVVHVHNTFPLLSPAIFHAIGAATPRVLTLHNYRVFCAAGIPVRDQRVCTECLDARSAAPALRHGCYRNSRVATLPLAASIELHRRIGTWARAVDAFIALSDFQKDVMAAAGLPAARIHVKPNFYPGRPVVVPWADRAPYVLYAGRLSAEKGVQTLARAWQCWGTEAPELRIAGDGELLPHMRAITAGVPVRYLGQLSTSDAEQQIAGARLLIVPSECFEGFPMVIREAFAFGTPVAASNLGPLPTIVHAGESGIVFDPADPASLQRSIATAWSAAGLLERLGTGARREFETKYTEDANYDRLMQIYQQVIR
jgi:glycosyltransferase involved in cell wall biosynthesis